MQRRKIWHDFPNKNSISIHFKSADNPKCPVKNDHIRAHTYISGYLITTETIDPPHCKIYIISQTDIKGNIPAIFINKLAESSPVDWINNLIKGCQMAKEKYTS